ncbi:MAG: hypothetical protein JRN06_13140 [Nitrososphaerota archaeon]|nr:hypothetical protein [Nitrososphaerota archaeon]MDG7009148.1 hypothetical protein [Nitrososphaerota archaeon]
MKEKILASTIAFALLLLTGAGAAIASGPTQPIPPTTCNGPPVLNLSYHVTNDEDSGMVGYWALDHYSKNIQVWSTGGDTYCALITYEGGWQTFAGALSPQNGVTENRSAAGNFNGFLEFTFTATSASPFSGNLPNKNYGGTMSDILLGTYGAGQTGPTNVFHWTSIYFTGFGNEVVTNWGYYYYMGNTLAWTNAASGSSGDVAV